MIGENKLYKLFRHVGWPTGNANAMAKTMARYMRRNNLELMMNPADIRVKMEKGKGFMTVRFATGTFDIPLPNSGPGETF